MFEHLCMCAQVYLTFYNPMDCPRPGDLPDSGIKPASPALQADSLPLSHQGSPYLSILEPKPWCRFCSLFFSLPLCQSENPALSTARIVSCLHSLPSIFSPIILVETITIFTWIFTVESQLFSLGLLSTILLTIHSSHCQNNLFEA